MTKYLNVIVVGIMPYDFVDQKSNRRVYGTKVYYTFDNGSDSLEGVATGSTSIAGSLPFDLILGNTYRIARDRTADGKVRDIFCGVLAPGK